MLGEDGLMKKKQTVSSALTIRDAESISLRLELSVEDEQARQRFVGVHKDILQEVASGLCTLEQAVAYLENFASWLRSEASIAEHELLVA